MIALDTNVVVRLFVEDDAAQTACAKDLVRRAESEGVRLLVTQVVVCEFAWVLGSCYGRSRAEIAGTLDVLLGVEQFEIDDIDCVRSALDAFLGGGGDFADYLIREHALRDGRSAALATFDRALLREAGFVHPDPKRWDAGVSLRERAPSYGRRRVSARR